MLPGVFDFKWRVPIAGFEWRDADAEGFDGFRSLQPLGRMLFERPYDDSQRFRYHSPDEESPALFLEFAGLPRDGEAEILRFANRYGLLGSLGFRWWEVEKTSPETKCRYDLFEPEPLHEWVWQAALLSYAIKINGLISSLDRNALKKKLRLSRLRGNPDFVYWEFQTACGSEPSIVPFLLPRHDPITKTDWHPVYPDGFATEHDDPLEVVKMWLCLEISRRISNSAQIKFWPTPKGISPEFQIIPKTLLALLWFQFGRAVAGNRQHRQCRECDRWFPLVPQDKGRKVFCSVPCKLKDYRNRQTRAIELQAAGRATPDIAAELDTDQATVQRWLAKKLKGA